ncbi:unnamed protein product [Microthlaspi erraticum]|uniref:Uncharacterized protein n=1 Tax=Microthlaspi erraticum TaxID=1685480 RepID=A0A6D2LNZ3_9BRAS|nr:unnamed protein product [Microthlaspi erraticum]
MKLASLVTSTQFGEEEELIKEAQVVLRNRFQALHTLGAAPLTFMRPKVQRRVQRQKVFQSSLVVPQSVPPDLDEELVSDQETSFVDRMEHPPIADVPAPAS